jgi:hypothetical protein
MITAKLEELIWQGKATFKTFVAGGATDKHVLTIEQDKFIIITDFTYFSHRYILPLQDKFGDLSEELLLNGFNTQLTILGNRGFNRYVFRNNFSLAQAKIDPETPSNRQLINVPFGNCKMDCYLLHTDSVSFNFSRSLVFNGANIAIAPPNVPAYPPPMDYGKDGQLNAENTIRNMKFNAPPFSWNIDNQNENPAATTTESYEQKEFGYPVGNAFGTTMSSFQAMKEQYAAPILLVNYVEIKGLPNNINSK